MTADQLTILVAEDHPLYRRALTTLLAGQDGWEVVAEAEDGIGAVTAAHTTQPDVVLMDLNLPGLDGIEATRRIVAASPHIAVLVLTMYDDDASVFAAVRAGARGYLLKGADQADIVRAVTAVAGGEAIFGPSVARRIIDFFAAPQGHSGSGRARLRRTHHARARGTRSHRCRVQQRRCCCSACAKPQDSPQPRLQHLHQAACRGPGQGDRAGA